MCLFEVPWAALAPVSGCWLDPAQASQWGQEAEEAEKIWAPGQTLLQHQISLMEPLSLLPP